MLRSVIYILSALTVFLFIAGLIITIFLMITGENPFSMKAIGQYSDDKGLSLLVGLIGMYVTRQK